MRSKTSTSKRLHLEQLEDRCLLAAPDPAIAYVAGSALMAMNADASNQTVLLSQSGRTFRVPAWSPDLDGSSTNGYQGTLAVETYTFDAFDNQIWLVDVRVNNGAVQASNVRILVDKNDPSLPALERIAREPGWSPDLDATTPGYQGQVVFTTALTLNVIDISWNGVTVNPVSGPNTSRVLFAVANPLGDSVGWPTWSNDGARVAFGLEHCNQLPDGSCDFKQSLVTINRDGTQLTTVIPEGHPLFPDWISDLDWSRTSARVAFIGSQDSLRGEPSKIYTVDVNLGAASLQEIPAAAYSNRSPTWSSDDPATATDETDQFLVFSGRETKRGPGKLYNIRRVQLSTGQTTVLTSSSKLNLLGPDWRPFPSKFASAIAAATALRSPSANHVPQPGAVDQAIDQHLHHRSDVWSLRISSLDLDHDVIARLLRSKHRR